MTQQIDWIEDKEAWLVTVAMRHADGVVYDASEYIYGYRDGIPEEKLAEVLIPISRAHEKRARFISNNPKDAVERERFDRMRKEMQTNG